MKKLWIVPCLFAAAGVFFTEELYRYTFCREGSALLARFLDKRGHEDAYYTCRDAAADSLRMRPRERMQIRSARGETLTGYYYPGSGDGKRIAFIVHGYRSEHAETAGMYYDYYASRGFDLFACDHTAHGESEGRFIGFDCLETPDCLLWIEELSRRFGDDIQIVLHGFSMGAATVMKMSDRCPSQVKAIVADSGYADGAVQLRSSLGPLYPLMRQINRLVSGYDLKDSDVQPHLMRARLPMLFVHGRLDKTVPFFNGPALFERYPGGKDCLFLDGARHVESMFVDPLRYAEKLDALLERSGFKR